MKSIKVGGGGNTESSWSFWRCTNTGLMQIRHRRTSLKGVCTFFHSPYSKQQRTNTRLNGYDVARFPEMHFESMKRLLACVYASVSIPLHVSLYITSRSVCSFRRSLSDRYLRSQFPRDGNLRIASSLAVLDYCRERGGFRIIRLLNGSRIFARNNRSTDNLNEICIGGESQIDTPNTRRDWVNVTRWIIATNLINRHLVKRIDYFISLSWQFK